jgi:hypothetical protein
MARKRYTRLRPERCFHMSKDIIERLMLDNMADQVFVQQSVKGSPAEADIRRALDNIEQRTRHIALHLIEVLRVQTHRDLPGDNGKVTPRDGDQASVGST